MRNKLQQSRFARPYHESIFNQQLTCSCVTQSRAVCDFVVPRPGLLWVVVQDGSRMCTTLFHWCRDVDMSTVPLLRIIDHNLPNLHECQNVCSFQNPLRSNKPIDRKAVDCHRWCLVWTLHGARELEIHQVGFDSSTVAKHLVVFVCVLTPRADVGVPRLNVDHCDVAQVTVVVTTCSSCHWACTSISATWSITTEHQIWAEEF